MEAESKNRTSRSRAGVSHHLTSGSLDRCQISSGGHFSGGTKIGDSVYLHADSPVQADFPPIIPPSPGQHHSFVRWLKNQHLPPPNQRQLCPALRRRSPDH